MKMSNLKEVLENMLMRFLLQTTGGGCLGLLHQPKYPLELQEDID